MQKSTKQQSSERESIIRKAYDLIGAKKPEDKFYFDYVRRRTTQQAVLDSAMKSFNYDIVKYLKENGVEKSDRIKGGTAFNFAAEEGTKEVMTLLLSDNADINAKYVDKITPVGNDVKADTKKYNYDKILALLKYMLDLFCIYKGDDDTKTIFHAVVDIQDRNNTALKDWLISFARKLGVNYNNYINFPNFFRSQMINYYVLSNERIDEEEISSMFRANTNFEAQERINRHFEELIAAGLYVSKQNIEAVSCKGIFHDSSAECLSEVEKMKKKCPRRQ